MAWTAADLASVEAAILALSLGTKTARVRNGTDEIEYRVASLPNLYKLRDQMLGELRTSSDGTSKVKFRF